MMSIWIDQASVAAAPPEQGWLIDPELVDAAYGQTIAGGTLQTGFPERVPPPPPSPFMQWISEYLGDFFQWSSPALKPVAIIAAILLALFLLYHFVPSFARWVDDLSFFRKRPVAEIDDVGQAEAGAARALLSEADALAKAGRYAEAVHLLLYRSVEDIEGRRPGLVRPAMTSRELAAARDLPSVARDAFTHIARAVEVSLFGGRAIDGDAWDRCRSAYAEMTVARNWARA